MPSSKPQSIVPGSLILPKTQELISNKLNNPSSNEIPIVTELADWPTLPAARKRHWETNYKQNKWAWEQKRVIPLIQPTDQRGSCVGFSHNKKHQRTRLENWLSDARARRGMQIRIYLTLWLLGSLSSEEAEVNSTETVTF